MYRLLVVAATGLGLLALISISVWGTEIGLLGEMIPWPMMCAGITGETLELAEKPGEAVSCPDCLGPLKFGLLELGDGSDPGVSCAVLEPPNAPPLLRLDLNNNKNLSDDPWLELDEQVGPRSYHWFATVTVRFASENGVVTLVPYHLTVFAQYSYESAAYDWMYGGFCQRKGVISIEGVSYAIAVASLTTTGAYGDLSNLVVAIDVDRDGTLDTLPYSHEVFAPMAPLALPTGTYRVAWMSNDGLAIHLEREGGPVARPTIARGEQAPGFSATGLAGETVSVPGESPAITVLLFVLELDSAAGCTTCSGGNPRTRAEQILQVISDLGEDVRLIVVAGSQATHGLAEPPESRVQVHVLYDPAINDLYRRTFGAFVIDQSDTIVAMDEAWSTVKCGRPQGAYAELTPLDIRWAIDRLRR